VIAQPCEADVIAGLEPFASAEIAQRGGRHIRVVRKGVLAFSATRLYPLLDLKTVLSVYRVLQFDVPRPRALLGDQHQRTLLTQVDAILSLYPPGTYRTFLLAAAGAHTSVMSRLRTAIASYTSLDPIDESGDLLIRVRPSTTGKGWDVLVRLSPKPLATRDWRVCSVEGALQATVAHVMVNLTHPQAEDVYLNLCCGSGTLLIERALAGPAQRLIGCDIDMRALDCARQNVAVHRGSNIELYPWDARRLPLPDASVDAMTADLPFGNRVGSHKENLTLYPQVLREAHRVIKPSARFVVITAEVRLIQRLVAQMSDIWQCEQMFRVDLGGLQPAIFVLRSKG
jgi:tRNA (guanine6-N2)-methyltransferase